jgi:DNA-binding CsgD family transcriptional regulator
MDISLAGPVVTHSGLLGRANECALLDDFVWTVRRGESRSIVLQGEAGIGKSALLTHVVASASDLTVVRAAGVESDMELAYASLQQLCGPLFGQREGLPEPQRHALESVFGMRAGEPPDRFLVGLAVLSLLSAAAEHRPLLCIIDDAQWLDQASALTLAFVARRLLAEPVGIVFASRQPDHGQQHLPHLHVHGVRDGDARALLSSAVPFKIDARVVDRIIAETRGNPLALLELPRGLSATQLAGGFGFLEAQTLTGRIEDSFLRRLEALSEEARRLLLIAAAEPVGDPLLLWRAAERFWVGPGAAEIAQESGLLTIGAQVTFRHPLVRSAIYRSAAPEDRRLAHLALAEATDRETDPDRRAWHLSAATTRPDERVAEELERSAGRAQSRGGLAAAAAFLERSVALTSDSTKRANRALAAAQASLQAGAFDMALRLVATAEAGPIDRLQSARVDLLRAHVAFAAGEWGKAPPLLLQAARRLEPFDLDLARETCLTAWGAAGLAEDLAAREVLLAICRAVRTLPTPLDAPRPVDLLLDGLAMLITEGHAVAAPTLQRAVQALADMPAQDVLRWGWMAVGACGAVWDYDRWYTVAARNVQVVRDAGELASLPIHLTYLGMASVWTGDFAGTASLIAEIDTVAAATGSRFPPYTLLRMRALQGRETEAAAAIANAVDEFGGHGMTATRAHWANAVLNNGLGRYEVAASAARQATSGAINHWVYAWVLPELVEAAARGGDPATADDALGRLAEATRPCPTDFASGIEARSRALLSDGAAAETLYRQAIDQLGRTSLRPELARAHLLYGEWLRRADRRVDSRKQLRAAHGMFSTMGMEAFADRARRELAATGENVRSRTVEARDDLTGQERQIARLASEGLSNPEIGARLFLSPRTVEWHLRNVFTKLGIRSRRELGNSTGSESAKGTT